MYANKPSPLMQSSSLSLWRIRAVAILLALVSAGAFFFMASSAHAAAPNGFTSQSYKDSDGNGTVDQAVIVINGGEALTTCTVTAASGEIGTDWTYTGGATFGGSISEGACVTGTATVTFTLTGVTAGVTGGGTAPTIAYDNDDADNSVANASGNLGTVTAQNLSDGAAPQAKTFSYSDVDADGKIDTFVITWTESVDAASVLKASHLSLTGVGDFTAAAFGSATTDLITGAGSTTTVALGTEATAIDTAEGSGTIAISSIVGDGTYSITDGTTAQTTAKAQSQATFADGAKPQFKSFTYQDADTDGKIDTFLITYSESTAAGSVLEAAEMTLTVGDFTAAAFGSATTDIADGGTTDSITLGTESSAEDTEENAGTIAVTTTSGVDNNFSLTDGTNNNTTEKAEAHVSFVDGAAAVLLSSTPTAAQTGIGRDTNVVLTFSEEIDTATDAISISPNVTHSETWSVSNTVLTLDGSWGAGLNTITFTTANDTATSPNAFAGAQSGDATVASPLTFYAVAASSSTGSATEEDETYDITVTSPNGGESYMPGDSVEITWDVDGGSAMSAVNLNLMYSNGGSTTQESIVADTANDGSYTWTVPNITASDAWIQAVGTDLVDSLATDTSDDAFSIGAASSSDDTSDDSSDDATVPSTGDYGYSPVTGELEEISEVSEGMYVRSSYFDTVYYIEEDGSGDLIRRPFMDAQTYMTYEDDWSPVETVTDATLPTMSLGGPMLPNPGIVLVKIQSDAKVYAIGEDGELRWVSSETVAIALFGSNWADYVIDIPATLFPRFDMGDDIDSAVDYDASDDMKTREEVNS